MSKLASAQDFSKQGVADAIAVLKQQFGDRLSESEAVRSHHSHTTTRIPQQLPDAFLPVRHRISAILLAHVTNMDVR